MLSNLARASPVAQSVVANSQKFCGFFDTQELFGIWHAAIPIQLTVKKTFGCKAYQILKASTRGRRLNRDSFDDVPCHPVLPAVVKPGGTGIGMTCEVLDVL